MTDYEMGRPKASRMSARALLFREWPYLAMLLLALFGVAYTSVSRQGMTIYWMILVPCFAVICIAGHWKDVVGRDGQRRLIRRQVLHWFGVILAMNLVFVADVEKMMNSDASALMALTVLALGAFTAGIEVEFLAHLRCRDRVGSWRSRHRVARGVDAASLAHGHCPDRDRRIVLFEAPAATGRIGKRIRPENSRFLKIPVRLTGITSALFPRYSPAGCVRRALRGSLRMIAQSQNA